MSSTISPQTSDSPTGLAPGVWNLDPARSQIGFFVLSMPPARGRFANAEGALTVAEDGTAGVTGTIRADSFSTGIALRDWHLKGPEFFSVKRFPEIRFESSSVEIDGSRLHVRGRLTIRGITRTVELAGTLSPDPGSRDVKIELAGKIKRRDFRVGTPIYAAMIGPTVKLALSLVARRVG
jgi:polyisoprenoid-binding protein YceI